jgi:hypothetical protein
MKVYTNETSTGLRVLFYPLAPDDCKDIDARMTPCVSVSQHICVATGAWEPAHISWPSLGSLIVSEAQAFGKCLLIAAEKAIELNQRAGQ